MDNALWMNHDFHPVHLDAKEPMRLDHFEPFVKQSGRIDRDFWSHVPGGMLQCLLDRDRSELFRSRFAKRAAGGGENNSPYIGRFKCGSGRARNASRRRCGQGLSAATVRGTQPTPTFQTLKDRIVL